MSEKENPELLAEEELDDVSGGGCCSSEEDYIKDCPKGYTGLRKSVSLNNCRGCGYLMPYQKKRIVTGYICGKPS
jgi:hypothetical protein